MDPHASRENIRRMNSELNLNNLSEKVMATWESNVRTHVESAGNLLRPALVDALPKFLNLLATALAEPDARGLIQESAELVREHASFRARESSFGAAQIIQEFQILRDSVTFHLSTVMRLTRQDEETIQRTFDESIQQALLEFFQVHAALKEEFTATLSHDLRNPIGIAQMAAEVIQEIAAELPDGQAKSDIHDMTEKILSNMRRADHMIQDLLDASILRIGEKLPVSISHVDLLKLANEVVSDFDDKDKSRMKVVGDLISGYWDQDGLRRCLENLLKNAVKYGCPQREIGIHLTKQAEHVQIAVHNFGAPISTQDQLLIFQNFGRSRSAVTGGARGWGIGLALVRAMSESMGGTITVESSEQSGTSFIITLPEDSRKLLKHDDLTH